MPSLWDEVKSQELGIPVFDHSSIPVCDGTATAWLPGMRVDIADWYLVLYHWGNLNRYVSAGGDTSRCIVHFLGFDTGLIDPMWGKETLAERIGRLREAGINIVVSPDFSAWADMPVAVQIHNTYRSAIVARDMARAGLKVIPNVYWSAPVLQHMQISQWGNNLPFCIVDMAHVNTAGRSYNSELFWRGAGIFKTVHGGGRVWSWVSSERAYAEWQMRVSNSVRVYSRAKMLNRLTDLTRRMRNEKAVAV